MPDMMSLPQPHHSMLMRPAKESPRKLSNGFPEYLKHADVLGDGCTKLKLTASNSLFHAVIKGRVRGTRLLLDRGTAVNGRNDYGYSVLTAALHTDDERRRDKLFRLLLDRGADPHFRDSTYSRSVLLWACVLGRTEQIDYLLREVAGDIDLQDRDRDGHTALHHAVMAGHMPIVQRLVDMHRKFGVSVDMDDRLGLTPYLHAKRLGYRDVAEYLHSNGQASQGHGDILFRTPREWSQIGKFERRKAIEIENQEAINIAKIRGKITHVRHMEDSMNSPRMAIPNIVVPSYSPRRDPGVKVKLAGGQTDRLSMSLPSLQEHSLHGDARPFSVTGTAPDNVDSNDSHNPAGAPLPPDAPREAFAIRAGSSPSGSIDPSPRVPHDHAHHVAWAGPTSPRKGPGSIEAFALMEMNEKGRHARTYRQSQFDETKRSEYKQMLGNLNSIMEILSEQQSKSFRQSVKYQRPETPKKKKPKNKVSSLAVIFGRDKSGRRSKRHQSKTSSPKPSAKASAKASAKQKGSSASVQKKSGGAVDEKKSKPPSEKKRAVPLLKVNDSVV